MIPVRALPSEIIMDITAHICVRFHASQQRTTLFSVAFRSIFFLFGARDFLAVRGSRFPSPDEQAPRLIRLPYLDSAIGLYIRNRAVRKRTLLVILQNTTLKHEA